MTETPQQPGPTGPDPSTTPPAGPPSSPAPEPPPSSPPPAEPPPPPTDPPAQPPPPPAGGYGGGTEASSGPYPQPGQYAPAGATAAGAPDGAYPPAPQQNPYGGYAAAPAYAGAGQAYPGNRAYVEQHFGPVAGFGKRVLALLIDTAITLIGLVPIIIGSIMLGIAAPDRVGTDEFGNPVLGEGDGGLAATGAIVLGLGILLTLAITIWNRIFRMGRRGQSVGKSVIGLMLVDTKSGQPIGAGKAFLREIVHSIVNQVFYLSYLWMLWDADKQTLGDKAVSSTVIEVPKKPA